MGGKGRYEVLILFENNGDTALQDVFIRDVIPSNFDIKDWHIRGAGGEKRSDVEMTTNQTEDGVEITWKVPVVAKGERLDVSRNQGRRRNRCRSTQPIPRCSFR